MLSVPQWEGDYYISKPGWFFIILYKLPKQRRNCILTNIPITFSIKNVRNRWKSKKKLNLENLLWDIIIVCV